MKPSQYSGQSPVKAQPRGDAAASENQEADWARVQIQPQTTDSFLEGGRPRPDPFSQGRLPARSPRCPAGLRLVSPAPSLVPTMACLPGLAHPACEMQEVPHRLDL